MTGVFSLADRVLRAFVRPRWSQLFLILLAIASTRLAASEPTTGSIGGVLYLEDGSRVRGTVTLVGSHLPSPRSVATNERGEFIFPYVPPARDYRLQATADSFGSVAVDSVQVFIGVRTMTDLALRPLISSEIAVSAADRRVDLTTTQSSTHITRDQFDRLPTRRDFQHLTTLAPAIVFDRFTLDPSISGATFMENDYIIEGISTRDVNDASSATKLTMDFVDSVEVITGQFSAEYGRATGGVINVVTRSGSNTYKGDVLGYVEDASFSPERRLSSRRGAVTKNLGHDKEEWAASLGGPLMRDRLWFFASYAPRDDDWSQELVNVRFNAFRREPFETKEEIYAGKLSFAANGSNLTTFSMFGDPTSRRGWFNVAQADPSAARRVDESGSENNVLRHYASVGRNTALTASIGRHEIRESSRAENSDFANVPQQVEMHRSGGFAALHGGPSGVGATVSRRDAISLEVMNFLGAHEIKAGFDYEDNLHESTRGSHAFYYASQVQIPNVGVRDRLIEQLADFSGHGVNRGTSAFLRDRWSIRPNLVIDGGIRWEQQKLSSSNGASTTDGSFNADGSLVVKNAGSFTFRNNWAPRLGIAWDPTARGRTKIYAAAGRYFEAVPVGINVYAMTGYDVINHRYYTETPRTSSTWYDPTGSPLDSSWSLYESTFFRSRENPSPIDEDTKLQYQDEITVGFEKILDRSWSVGARLVAREMGQVIEDLYIRNETDPTTNVAYIIGNPEEIEYTVALPEPRRSYRAIELMVQRRLTDRWQMFASFVSARQRGNYDGYYHYPTGFGIPNATPLFENPRWMQNSSGRLRGDRPYVAKIQSSYSFPIGASISQAFVYSSGTPVSAMVSQFGNQVIYLTPRGSEGRTPDVWSLDLHMDWRIPMKLGDASASIIADLFNATNNDSATDVDEEYAYFGMPGWEEWDDPSNLDEYGLPRFSESLPVSPYYKTGTSFQAPRSLQMGIKVSF